MGAAKRGALGGANNEAGGNHRAGIAALLAVYGLLGEKIPWLEAAAPPVTLHMEEDVHVDDVVVGLADGTRAYMQAKLSGTEKAFKDTVDQWCRAVASGECRPGDELLLVVTEAPLWLQRLAKALTTRRAGASLTSGASKELGRLRQLAAGHGLGPATTAQLLDAVKICVLDARDGGRDEALGVACLNAAVVPPGHGAAAFRALRAEAHTQAEKRARSDIEVWRSWLADAQLPLVADASGTPAARLEAQHQAVAGYREEWAAEQDILPLADLGLGLTSLTIAGLTDNLRASPQGERRRGRDGLVDTVRRQGRLFLVGRPGSGKTVASRLIAARWAATGLAPVPVWLRLRDLLPLLPAAGPYRLEVADVVRAAVGGEQPVLQEALVQHVERGQALLLLDALDEVLDRRDAVVEAVTHFIGRLPAELDVVITSRHSSAQAASLLRLPVYELQDPQRLSDTLDELLRTAADRFAGSEDTDAWIADRMQRIEHSRRAESALWQVPLLATLMVLLIAQRPSTSMPTSRAGLLTEVIDSSVRRWEMRRTTLAVPGTESHLTADVLLDCFDDIAHLVAANGSAAWQDAHDAVSARLQHHWGKPPGAAAAAARHIIEYWDATAGVFITDTPQGTLTARTRLFAEVGEVRWALRDPQAVGAWMDDVLADTERGESARLAASLSPTAAVALITRAIRDGGSLLDLVHGAAADGAVFGERSLHAYRQAQLARLDTAPDSYPDPPPGTVLNLDLGRSPRAELAARLAADDLDATQTTQLLTVAARFSPRQQAVITALCAERQARQRATALTDDELDTLEAGLLPADSDSRQSSEVLAGLDPLVRAAVTHLLPQRPHIAPALVATAYGATLDTLEWLEAELPRLGHENALRALSSRMTPPDLVNWIARSRQAFRAPFDLLAQLINTSVDLTPAQAWHLDEAAAFTASLGIADQTAGTPGQAVQREPRLTERICRIALDASGLDPALLIAQLRSLRDENPEHPDWGLLFQPSDRDPGIELAPETIDTDVALQALRSGNSWLVSLVLLLAANASRLPEGFPDQLVTVLPTLSVKTRLRTAILLAHRWPDLSLPDSDPATRAGAARVRARTLAATQHHRDALDLLADPDLLVRAEAASFLYRVPPDVKAALEEALATPAEQWTCIHCGTVMPDTADACPHRHPRPQPLLAAD